MANKPFKGHWTLFVLREMQIIIIMCYHYAPIRMANIKKQNSTFHTLPAGMQNVIDPLENSLGVFNKVNIYLPCDPEITHWDIYPREIKTYVHTHAHTNCRWMLIAVLFLIAPNWEHSKWPLGGAWYTHTREHCSAIKRDRLLTDTRGWMHSAKWEKPAWQG